MHKLFCCLIGILWIPASAATFHIAPDGKDSNDGGSDTPFATFDKALDVVGDLALAGCDLVGDFVAYRSGHRQNAELVRALLSEYQVVDQRRRSA